MEENTESIQTKCPSCDSSVSATKSTESNILTYLSTIFLILTLHFWSIFILPLSIPLSKSLSLRCPNCKTLIKKQKFSLKSLNDEVLSIQFKNFALIFSRRYLLIFLLVSYTLCLILTSNTAQALKISGIPWEEYLEDCSASNIINNKAQVFEVFSNKYFEKVVSWEGYLMKATLNSGWFQGEHAGLLYIKMDPTESEIYPDLVITFNEDDLETCKSELTSLNRGDKVAFNATLISVADEDTIHHLHGHQVRKLDGFIDIPYEMKSFYRTSARPSVELISVVDKVNVVSHDHVHVLIMAEVNSDIIPDQINDLFNQLQLKVNVIDVQIGQILQVHENEFLNAYRIHMVDIQKEIQQLKFNISQEELKRRRDAEIIIREKERDWFRDEALRLNKVCKEYMKSTEVWKSKAKMLEEDKKILEDRLRILSRKSESKLDISKTISPLKLPEQSKSFITDSVATLNLKPEPSTDLAISHLKSELSHYKSQIKQIRSESTTLIARRHKLETLFEECVQLAREDSKQINSEDQKILCSNFEDLQEPEKRKILYNLLSKPEVSELLKSFVFRTRKTVTPSKYLQRNSTSSHGLKNHVFSTPKRQVRVRHLPYYN